MNRQAWISGRVQGVAYRVSTQREALRLNVKGYARNLSDGRVEVLMSGEKSRVEALTQWLYEGPAFARVDSVELKDLPFEELVDFTTA